MTTLKISLITLMAALAFTSCNKREVLSNTEFSEDEVVELVSNAMAYDAYGIASDVEEVAKTTMDDIYTSYECNVTVDSSFTKSLSYGNASGDFNFAWEWTPTCNSSDIITQLDFASDYNGIYSTNRVDGEDNSVSSYVITSFLPLSTPLVINGSTSRSGEQVVTLRHSKDVSSTITFDLVDIEVDKINFEIESGTASFVFVAEVDESLDVNYVGSIEFHGNGQATIIINGESYDVEF